MNKWRFAFQRRWITYLVMAIVFAIACGFLSRWQFGRNAQVSALHTLVYSNYSAAPVSIGALLPGKTAYSPEETFRRVSLRGTYLTSKQLLVRDRTYNSNPGFEVLTPLRLTNGSIFIVDRGWVAVGTSQDRPDYVPAPPRGTVSVIARLQGSENVLPGRVAPRGEIPEINLPTVAKRLSGSTYTGAYGLLARETPAPADRPLPAKKPLLDNGPFLSYAVQWILFALLAFGGLFWALRQEYRVRNADDPEEMLRAEARERRARMRAPTDADIEDGQIRDARNRDAQIRDAQNRDAQIRDAQNRDAPNRDGPNQAGPPETLVDAGWRPLGPEDY